MKSQLKLSVIIIIAVIIGFVFDSPARKQLNNVKRTDNIQQTDRISKNISNISNWAYWMYDDGRGGMAPDGYAGGFYPRGTEHAIFTDGFIVGAYVRDGLKNPRFEGAVFWPVFKPGWVENGIPISEDDQRIQVYRIRSDWESLQEDGSLEELRQDAGEFFMKDPQEVTDADMLTIWEIYRDHWNNWPTDLGAPFYDVDSDDMYTPGVENDLNSDGEITIGEREEPGYGLGDQVLWFVTHDLDTGKIYKFAGSKPIGLEIQTTVWAYNQPSATLGQLIFKKYNLINVSGFDIDSMYVGYWSDPDVGYYSDDLVGCDTTRSLGFAYSGFPTDSRYNELGLPPPAVGYDFFQGPLVTGMAGQDRNKNDIPDDQDSGIFGLKKIAGKINLPMTSFFFFGYDSAIPDPEIWISDHGATLQYYNMMRGYQPTTDLANPRSWIIGSGSDQGKPTKFPLSGDPLRRTGDIDGTGNNQLPGDRRLGICSGPFTMAPQEEQEIVFAIVGGIVTGEGGNNVNSVEQMKLNDDFAQFMYDNLFQSAPRAPEQPKVSATAERNKIILEWGSNHEAVSATESIDPILGFNFEGYNIYQLPGATATKDQSKLIATFDLNNDVTTIWGKKFDSRYNKVLDLPLQDGTNSGIQRFITIEEDHIIGGPLFAGTPYHFAVTAYNYSPDPNLPEPTLESSLLPAITVIPQPPIPGTRYPNVSGDLIPVIKHGFSTGEVVVEVVDPAALHENNYEVSFENTPQYNIGESDDTLGIWYKWRLINDTNQDTLLTGQLDLSGDKDKMITDGFLVRVMGPKTSGYYDWDYTGERWVSGVNWGGRGLFGGLDIGANSAFGSTLGPADLVPVRMEFQDSIDVAQNGFISQGAVYRRDLGYAFSGIGEIPFACYDVSDSENPRQLNICFVEDDTLVANNGSSANLIWDMGWNPDSSTFAQSGGREYICIMNSDYSGGTEYDDQNWGPAVDVLFFIWPQQRGSRPYLLGLFTLDIFVDVPNTPDDYFTFSTESIIERDQDLAKADIEKINVFPNPYYAFNPEELNRFDRFVKFTHLPRKATIRIFNLSGVQVRKLEKNDESQFFTWDLENQKGFPIASGMYIAYIDLPDLGKQKVLKLMIIQGQEIIEAFR